MNLHYLWRLIGARRSLSGCTYSRYYTSARRKVLSVETSACSHIEEEREREREREKKRGSGNRSTRPSFEYKTSLSLCALLTVYSFWQTVTNCRGSSQYFFSSRKQALSRWMFFFPRFSATTEPESRRKKERERPRDVASTAWSREETTVSWFWWDGLYSWGEKNIVRGVGMIRLLIWKLTEF